MLVTKTYHDIPSALDKNGRPIRIFVIAPNVPGYPNAKFPGKARKRVCMRRCADITSYIVLGVVCFRYRPHVARARVRWLIAYLLISARSTRLQDQ